MTLEEYLRTAAPGAIDFRLRAEPTGADGMTCYLHPIDRHGATLFFELDGNAIVLKETQSYPPLQTFGFETGTIETSEDPA